MKNNFENELFRRYWFICSIGVMFFFVFNPQGLSFGYGSGNGRYADRVDSFSEYIVRNTIKRNILNKDNSSLLPVVTKGFPVGDYSYYSDDQEKYVSNLTFQTIPATVLANFFWIDTELKLDRFFGILRLANALILSIFVVGIFLSFCGTHKNSFPFLIPFLVGCSSGLIYFSQNLYFASSLIVLPAFYIAMQLRCRQTFNNYLVFLFGVFYFLRGYEFSTVFALLTAFSAALFTLGDITKKSKSALLAFALICLAFVVVVALHVVVVAIDNGAFLGDAAESLFRKIQHRTQSATGVPFPFSVAFVKEINERWVYPAFSVNAGGFFLSQLNIILIMFLLFIVRLRKITDNEIILYLFGFFGYASWYIFAYQHIMWHQMYDWYIFALTMGLSFSLLLLFYLSLLVDLFHGICSRFVKYD